MTTTPTKTECPEWCTYRHPADQIEDGTEHKRVLVECDDVTVDLVSGWFSDESDGRPRLAIWLAGNHVASMDVDPLRLYGMGQMFDYAARQLEGVVSQVVKA